MALIHLVVNATSQVYTLLYNIHQPPKACAAAVGIDPAALLGWAQIQPKV